MDRELIERLAIQVGFEASNDYGLSSPLGPERTPFDMRLYAGEYPVGDSVLRFAALIAEECAKVCDAQRDGEFRTAWDQGRKFGAFICAALIRDKFTPHSRR